MVKHAPFSGTIKKCFSETSLHLSFTKYEVPLLVPIGAMDAEVSMIETLVSTSERKRWVADLDIIAGLRNEEYFKRLRPARCTHTGSTRKPRLENAAVQIGKLGDRRLIAIDCWEELLDPPEGLGEVNVGVLRAGNSWHARVAAMSISVQKRLRTVVLPIEPLCTVCGIDSFRNMGAFAQILIL